MKNGHPINPSWSREMRRISVADRNLRDPRYCCRLVSRREILTQPPLVLLRHLRRHLDT